MSDDAQAALGDFETWAHTHLALQRASKSGGQAAHAAELARRGLDPEQWQAASAHWWEVLRQERAAGGSPRLQRFEEMLAAPGAAQPQRGRLEPMAEFARTAQASQAPTRPAVPFQSAEGAAPPPRAVPLEPNLSLGETKAVAPPSHSVATPFVPRGRLEPLASLGETAPASKGPSSAEIPFPSATGPARPVPLSAATATPFDARRAPTSVPQEVAPGPSSVPLDDADDAWPDEDELEPLSTEPVAAPQPEDVLQVLRECGANEQYLARVRSREGEA